MYETNDRELVVAIQKGNIIAYEKLVVRYQRGLFVFVMRIVHDEAVASEVVQDALFNVYRHISRVDPERKFSTYMFEIAKNTAFSAIRSKKATVSLEEIVDIEDDEPFIEQIFRSDRIASVKLAVSHLPQKYKRVITLYYFHELSYEEVSRELHIPVNTVRTHLKRAKVALRKKLHYEENT
ncbi:MAG TPA: RNA polymerase sigma factor [Patescibacteria group bacterium]|jgi:RNA polymerase sigma-70 factor (ECF subfamily)|nr:RNA polymerase sigma factor [Patescibacteria group bacterium]